jgi:hypothetical protein
VCGNRNDDLQAVAGWLEAQKVAESILAEFSLPQRLDINSELWMADQCLNWTHVLALFFRCTAEIKTALFCTRTTSQHT